MAIRKRKTTEEKAVYQLHVSLLDTHPPIWRRLLVHADLSLAQLHNVLQIAMGWENIHLHSFRTARRRFGQPEPADPFSKSPVVEDERRVRLSAVLLESGEKMIYTYDFGDNWEHEVVFEQQLPVDANTLYPTCIDGRLACPPEDCGGIPGYCDLLKILAIPSHRRYKELREWLGRDFCPEEFSPEEVNRSLAPRKRSRKALVR